MSGKLVALCEAAAVTADTPIRVEHDDYGYAVFKLGDDYIVTADQCTHGPGQLSEGTVMGDEIECPFHGGRFELRTGKPSYPPCSEPVRVWTAHLVEGRICIDPTESR